MLPMHVNEIQPVLGQLTNCCQSPIHIRSRPSIKRNRSTQNHFLFTEYKSTFDARFSCARTNHPGIGSPT
ncbi:MAG: hypothetical protein JZU63_04080, partial [Rhodoferax sp.]|nr:hypothetical protein [Rhodoferax sp.]